jgi:hypothetical protein
MKTRSQTKLIEYTVDIDFDEASNFWNANKKKIANCCYQYVCGEKLKNGNFCKRNIVKDSTTCSIHKNKKE